MGKLHYHVQFVTNTITYQATHALRVLLFSASIIALLHFRSLSVEIEVYRRAIMVECSENIQLSTPTLIHFCTLIAVLLAILLFHTFLSQWLEIEI